jgi:hypothetical protein
MKRRPPDFENPYPAFIATFPERHDHVTLAQIGVQSPGAGEGEDAVALRSAIERSLSGEHAPDLRDRCRHVDAQGRLNEVVLAYWRERSAYDAWAGGPARAWSDEVPDGETGWWRETFTAPLDQLETSYSNAASRWGVGGTMPKAVNEFHSYFGAMRDRIAAAEDDGLPGELAALPAPRPADGRGRLVTVRAPEHLCFIRTVQGWSGCPEPERRHYLERMDPVYRQGADFLRDHPEETGCVSARMVDVVAAGSDEMGIQTQTLAWFTSLAALERWTHSHPTHLAILAAFGELAERFAPDIHVLLGHEVYVPSGDQVTLEYANCHGSTGFLPFADAMRPVPA